MIEDLTDWDCESRYSVLQVFFKQKISLRKATDKLAYVSLADDCLSLTWNVIITCARLFPEHHDKLVDLLLCLSKLPDAMTDQGEPQKQYGMQIWKDLPTLSWDFREEWNEQSIPSGPPDHRQKAISSVINLNRFTALLMATEEHVFNYAFFALATFSDALETPSTELSLCNKCLDAMVPAAAAWIEILGIEIYEWDDAEKPSGPLWKGPRRFCEERWSFWRKRFMELAHSDEIGEEARIAARESATIMEDIENGDVED